MAPANPTSATTRAQGKLLGAIAAVFCIALCPDRWFFWQWVPAVGLAVLTCLAPLPVRLLGRRLLALVPLAALMALGHGGQPDWPRQTAHLLVRAGLSLWVMMLLVSTTPMAALLGILRRWGLPAVVVEMLSFWERYLHVLTAEWERMRLARLSRTFHPSRRREFAGLAQGLGLLFIRSYERAERIHQARLARGYRGVGQESAVGAPFR